jgi:putative ABC transport system permease protein
MSSMMGSMGGFGGSMGGGNAGGNGAGTGATEIPKYYTLTLRELGGVDLPNLLKIYPTNFDFKDSVTNYLDKWNGDGDITVGDNTLNADNREDITYTDALSLVIGLINNLINIVTTALICFTALSLVVSTVMIAIITYVSVIERIKEIGVIRSLGGRKKDVSHLFNAETFIIGSLSGLIGIGVTYLLSAMINLIVGALVGINTIATLTPLTAIIMVLISVILTSISGLVPAKLAAKKDPVDALRSE